MFGWTCEIEEASVTQNYVCHELVPGIELIELTLEALSFSYQEFLTFSVLSYAYTLIKKNPTSLLYFVGSISYWV